MAGKGGVNDSPPHGAENRQTGTRSIAGGRDCDVYDAGPGKILRRARDGRNVAAEVVVMRYARGRGYPVPEVYHVDGANMVMERIPGPNLYKDLCRRPWRVFSHSRLLADLHRRLATIQAPDWLGEAAHCPGERLVHLDLHPVNVLMGEQGPRVIDWTTASRGPSGVDVAMTWMLIAAGPLGGPKVARVAKYVMRWLFLHQFLKHAGREQARQYLPAVLDQAKDRIGRFDGAVGRMERLIAAEARPTPIGLARRLVCLSGRGARRPLSRHARSAG